MAKVSVQIVTWNSARYIGDCLDALQRQTMTDFSVVVIDNGSRDGTVELVRSGYPTAAVLENFKNVGFARGNNQGIKMAKGEYVLVLNPDVIVTPTFLERIVAFADSQPQAASFGGKLLKLKSQSINEVDGEELQEVIQSDIIDSTGLVIKRSRNVIDRGAGCQDTGQFDRSEEVFGISGACALYRRSMLTEVAIKNEYFDEDFFAYKEDIDLAWRLRLYGFLSFYVHDAVAYHHRGFAGGRSTVRAVLKSRRLVSRFIRSLSLKNHHLLLCKNDQLVNVLLGLPWIGLQELRLFFYTLFFEPFQFKTIIVFIKQLPRTLIKRRVIMAHAVATARDIRRWFR